MKELDEIEKRIDRLISETSCKHGPSMLSDLSDWLIHDLPVVKINVQQLRNSLEVNNEGDH